MNRYVLDTNVVIRFLRNDHPMMSQAATALVQESAQGKVELHLETTILAEAVFVLTSFYKKSRSDVADALRDLITGCRLKMPGQDVALNALNRFKQHAVDFPDALAAAVAASENMPVASFDRDFDKFTDIRRFEPKT